MRGSYCKTCDDLASLSKTFPLEIVVTLCKLISSHNSVRNGISRQDKKSENPALLQKYVFSCKD